MSQELLHDVLSLDAGLLSPDAWHALAGATAIEIRRGDLEDPLAGVVRLSRWSRSWQRSTR